MLRLVTLSLDTRTTLEARDWKVALFEPSKEDEADALMADDKVGFTVPIGDIDTPGDVTEDWFDTEAGKAAVMRAVAEHASLPVKVTWPAGGCGKTCHVNAAQFEHLGMEYGRLEQVAMGSGMKIVQSIDSTKGHDECCHIDDTCVFCNPYTFFAHHTGEIADNPEDVDDIQCVCCLSEPVSEPAQCTDLVINLTNSDDAPDQVKDILDEYKNTPDGVRHRFLPIKFCHLCQGAMKADPSPRCALCFGVLDKDGKCNAAPLFKDEDNDFGALEEILVSSNLTFNDELFQKTEQVLNDTDFQIPDSDDDEDEEDDETEDGGRDDGDEDEGEDEEEDGGGETGPPQKKRLRID